MLVQAIDNKFYKNPVIFFEDYVGYFIWRDLEEPEIIMRDYSPKSYNEQRKIKRRANKIIKKNYDFIKLNSKKLISYSTSAFPPLFSVVVPSIHIPIEVGNKITIPDLHEGVTDYPNIIGNWKAWEMEFNYYQLLKYYNDSERKELHSLEVFLGKKDRVYTLRELNKQLKQKYGLSNMDMKVTISKQTTNGLVENKVVLTRTKERKV